MTFLIIGGTGEVGSRVCRRLAGRNDVRALARSDASCAKLRAIGISDVVRGDLEDAASLDPAMQGVERMFLLTYDRSDGKREELNAIASAKAAGVKRIVLMSSAVITVMEGMGIHGPPENGPDTRFADLRTHQDAENALLASGIEAVILRPTWFSNFHEVFLVEPGIRAGQLVWWRNEAHGMALIDPEDIAEVVVASLLAETAPAGILNLTGPAALDFTQIARELSASLRRPIAYAPLDDEAYVAWLASHDILPAEVGAQLIANDVMQVWMRGAGAAVTNDVERILGRPPTPYATYLANRTVQTN